MNYGFTEAQCFVPWEVHISNGVLIRFRDLLSSAVYDRVAFDIAARGLYLDMPPWGYHVFAVES